MPEPARKRMSFEEFLAFEGEAETRYELIGGEPVAMAPPSPQHSVIESNAARIIDGALDPTGPCYIAHNAGIQIEAEDEDRYYAADVIMTCEPLESSWFPSPRLIVEVLSPSTHGVDKHRKVPDYMRLPSVEEIWLIESRFRWVLVWQKVEGTWIGSRPYIGSDVFTSRLLTAEVDLDRLYRRIGV